MKPFIAASKKKTDTRIKKWVLPIGLARMRQREAENARARERARTRERECEREGAHLHLQSFAVPMNAREWPTHLVYKRCRGGRVTVEL